MIPEGWKSQKLEEVCTDIVDCHHSTPAWTNAGFIVLRTQNIRSGVIDFSSIAIARFIRTSAIISRNVSSSNHGKTLQLRLSPESHGSD
jgi:hypothetical protein